MLSRRTTLVRLAGRACGAGPTTEPQPAGGKDHDKEALKQELPQRGIEVVDCGAESNASVDYPDYAFRVAARVALFAKPLFAIPRPDASFTAYGVPSIG